MHRISQYENTNTVVRILPGHTPDSLIPKWSGTPRFFSRNIKIFTSNSHLRMCFFTSSDFRTGFVDCSCQYCFYTNKIKIKFFFFTEQIFLRTCYKVELVLIRFHQILCNKIRQIRQIRQIRHLNSLR